MSEGGRMCEGWCVCGEGGAACVRVGFGCGAARRDGGVCAGGGCEARATGGVGACVRGGRCVQQRASEARIPHGVACVRERALARRAKAPNWAAVAAVAGVVSHQLDVLHRLGALPEVRQLQQGAAPARERLTERKRETQKTSDARQNRARERPRAARAGEKSGAHGCSSAAWTACGRAAQRCRAALRWRAAAAPRARTQMNPRAHTAACCPHTACIRVHSRPSRP